MESSPTHSAEQPVRRLSTDSMASTESLQDSGNGPTKKSTGVKAGLYNTFVQPMKDLSAYVTTKSALDTDGAHKLQGQAAHAKHGEQGGYQPLSGMSSNAGNPVFSPGYVDEGDSYGFGAQFADLESSVASSDVGSMADFDVQENYSAMGYKDAASARFASGDVTNLFGQPLVGAKYADIVLKEGQTKVHSFVAAALKVKLAVSNTQIESPTDTSTKGGKLQQFAKKGPEAIIHGFSELASSMVTVPMLLAANKLADLGGSFEEVKASYAINLAKFGGEDAGISAKIGARSMQACAFIQWAVANSAALVTAGLSMIVNVALGLVDKIASGSIALTVNAVAIGTSFIGRHLKGTGIALVAGAVLTGLVYIGTFLAAKLSPAAGAALGITAAKVLGAVLGVYLIIRLVRLCVQSYETTGQAVQKGIYLNECTDTKVKQMLLLAELSAGSKGNDQAEAKESALMTFYGSDQSRKYLASKTDSTHSRVISRGTGHFVRAAGRDTIRTIRGQWSAGADDVTVTQRALAYTTDEQLEKAVADYKVNKKVIALKGAGSENVVRKALMVSLTAGREVAKAEFAASSFATDKDRTILGDTVSGDELAKARATAYLLSGSDAEIFDAVTKYTTADQDIYSATIAAAIEGVDLEVTLNKVALTRELAAMRKEAPAMMTLLHKSKSGFVSYLKTEKHYTVTAADGDAVRVLIGDEGADFAKATKENPYTKADVFNAAFGVEGEYEIDGREGSIADIAGAPIAVALLSDYKEYTALSAYQRGGHYRAGHKSAPKAAETVVMEKIDLDEPVLGMLDGAAVVDPRAADGMLDGAAVEEHNADMMLDGAAVVDHNAADVMLDGDDVDDVELANVFDGLPQVATRYSAAVMGMVKLDQEDTDANLALADRLEKREGDLFGKANATMLYFSTEDLTLLVTKDAAAVGAFLDAVVEAYRQEESAESNDKRREAIGVNKPALKDAADALLEV